MNCRARCGSGRHLITRFRIGDDECPVRIRIEGREHQHEARSAGPDIGDGAGDVRVCFLVRKPGRHLAGPLVCVDSMLEPAGRSR